MGRSNELSTGDFAKLCRITKKTLFHYDKIHLLKPVRIDTNGYRVYTIEQYDKVSTIKLLQKIGMSLQEIQDFFLIEDFSRKNDFLLQQQQAAEAKIKELRAISDGIEFLTKRFAHFRKIGFDAIFEETLTEPEAYFLTNRTADRHQSVNAMVFGYQYGVLFDREELVQPMPDFSHIFQRSAAEKANFRKPAGRYLCIYKLLGNDEMRSIVPVFLKEIAPARTTGPLFHEDYCSDIAGFTDRFIIKLSIRLVDE